MRERRFTVVWVSVDGAGRYAPSYRHQRAAEYLAESRARACNTDVRCGVVNPWGYRFRVEDDRGRTVYRAPFVHGSLERLAAVGGE